MPPWQEISTVSSRVNVRGAPGGRSSSTSSMYLFATNDFAELDGMCRRGGRFYLRNSSQQAENIRRRLAKRAARRRSRTTASPAFTERRGDGGYGVIGKHSRFTVYDLRVFVRRVNRISQILNSRNVPAIPRLVFCISSLQKKPRLFVTFALDGGEAPGQRCAGSCFSSKFIEVR